MSNTRSDAGDGGFAGQRKGVGVSTERAVSDPRGQMYREKRLMSDKDTREFLRFGPVRILDDRAKKTWFFDRIVAQYGEPAWTFTPGYPHLDQIILYQQQIAIVTGKHREGLYH